MSRLRQEIRHALTVVVLALILAGCAVGGQSKEEQLKGSLDDAATSVPGVVSSEATAEVNTSGNFLGAVVVADTEDPGELKDTLRNVLKSMLDSTKELASGTLTVGVFSPDKTQSVSVDDLGYAGLENLAPLREFFSE